MAAAGRTAARLVALATLVGLCAGDAWGAARSLLRRRPACPADALPRTGRIVGAAPDEPLRLGSGCGPAFVGLSPLAPGLLCSSARRATGPAAALSVAPRSLRETRGHGRAARGGAALTTVCIFEQVTKGLGDVFGTQGKNDVDALKKILVSCSPASCILCARPSHPPPRARTVMRGKGGMGRGGSSETISQGASSSLLCVLARTTE